MSMRLCLTLLVGLSLAACSDAAPGHYQGYVEGDFTRLSARDASTILRIDVAEGDVVSEGVPLFALNPDRAMAGVAQAQASVDAAEARLADLEAGGRTEEIAAAEDRVAAATAERDLARSTYRRTQGLASNEFATRQQLERDLSALRAAESRLQEAQAQLDLVRQPARSDAIAAARADAAAARAALHQAQLVLADMSVRAPVAGTINEIYLHEGEFAAPGAPVISLLKPSALRIRLFIPEPELGSVSIGQMLDVRCDGCPEGLTAEVTYISSVAEFTPNQIFSLDERGKLVYLVEATPQRPDAFHPGQPVDASVRP